MEKNFSVSVAMATYNGEKYIEEQILSILNQSYSVDEIIISDDGSTDETINIIKKFNCSKIKIENGPHLGVKKNFENAIKKCHSDIIFLADQDDIWVENKVECVINEFLIDEDISLIVHDAVVFEDRKNNVIYDSFFEFRKCGKGILKNIYKNTYIGCCMAFRKKIIDKIIPIPNSVEMHDQWIGIINEMICGKSKFINNKLLKYRRHSNNTSSFNHYGLYKMIKNRAILIVNILKVIR